MRSIPAQQLDALVWGDLCAVLIHPEMIAEALKRAQGGAWLPQAVQARHANLRTAEASLWPRLERPTAAYLAGVTSLEDDQRPRHERDQRRQALVQQAHQLEASVARPRARSS